MSKSDKQDLSLRVVSSLIEAPAAGLRLDFWLGRRFSYRSRKQWQDEIRAGTILLNGHTARGSRILRAGDEVSYHPRAESLEEPLCDLNYQVCHEDEDMLVLNKPGNLPSHPAGRFFQHTLWRLLQDRWPGAQIVNRLDRETSGLVIAAKNPASTARLSALFADGKVRKSYFVLVHGVFEGEATASGFLGPDGKSAVRKKRLFISSSELPAPSPGWESAETLFSGLGSSDGFSAIRAEPKTGRLHQIRATLLSMGFPILGDKLYGLDEKFYLRFIEGGITENDQALLVMPRQALHAAAISFKEPESERVFRFEIAPPGDMLSLWQACTGLAAQ
ncbi:MAG: hypothetical protein A2X49_08380 [Lentisphaerae bacterium GWF2_52_8]|nr:MAG: hypothetical protein A2X49_08380 [Lentisphaerae bacterium GWF2_52_8]